MPAEPAGEVRLDSDAKKLLDLGRHPGRLSGDIFSAQQKNLFAREKPKKPRELPGVEAARKIGKWARVAQRRRQLAGALFLEGKCSLERLSLETIPVGPKIIGIGAVDRIA